LTVGRLNNTPRFRNEIWQFAETDRPHSTSKADVCMFSLITIRHLTPTSQSSMRVEHANASAFAIESNDHR